MINKKVIYKRPYDDLEIEGRLIEQFEHTNKSLGTKNISVIFYKDKFKSNWNNNIYEKMVFRYIESDDDRLTIFDNISKYDGNSKYELIKKYGTSEFYIEDGIYNFVNYDGIKY